MMRKISPILLEVIEGTIESSMVEMNLQVDRTARSTVFSTVLDLIILWVPLFWNDTHIGLRTSTSLI